MKIPPHIPHFFLYAHSRNFIIHKYWHTHKHKRKFDIWTSESLSASKPGLDWVAGNVRGEYCNGQTCKIIVFKKSNYLLFFYFFISFCLLFFSFHFLHISLFRFAFVGFVSISLISFRFVSFLLISFRFYFVSHFIGTHKWSCIPMGVRKKQTNEALFPWVYGQ
jgi:hypothetical protein